MVSEIPYVVPLYHTYDEVTLATTTVIGLVYQKLRPTCVGACRTQQGGGVMTGIGDFVVVEFVYKVVTEVNVLV